MQINVGVNLPIVTGKNFQSHHSKVIVCYTFESEVLALI